MKTSFSVILLAAVLVLASFGVKNSYAAASGTFTGTVKWVQSVPNGSGTINQINIQPAGNSSSYTYVIPQTSGTNQVIAIALTALSAGKNVQFQYDTTTYALYSLSLVSN
jgi:ABC-type glycerol-3-phosphate transport system substrate-binding protein